MKFEGFDWDAGNREKCRKHGVSIFEIEALFEGEPRVGRDPYPSGQERRFRAVGVTSAGRNLFVVFTWRRRGADLLVRPLSARYMHSREVKAYEKEVS